MNNKKANEQAKPANYKVPKFEIGDLAVYPAHGVGMIEEIEKKVINGETHDFYMMK
ncbi:MAG: CarD family transcriptional regulator, partial [Deltaproteobacteria bacterium]|nr:CarD family transcriptional regulator [Deltaproteobacteria bacterium]